MRRFGKTLAMLAIAMMTTLMVVDLAEARRAGGGLGSRGTRTFSAPPVTRTAPNNANSIDRSMTPRPEGQSATQPGVSQPGAAQTRPGAQRPGGFLGGFGGSMLGGLMMGGLIGMMLGNGLGGGMGFLGMLLQIGLILGAVMLAMRFFGRRQQPAYPGNAVAHSGNDAGPLYREQPHNSQASASSSFRIPQIGGGSTVPQQAAADTDEIGVGEDDLNHFETMLKDVQAAYGAEDYGALRKLTTPEAMSYLAEELSDNATSGLRNEVRDVQLVQGDVAEAWHEEGRDYATVAMRYESIDVMRDRNTGSVVEGDPDNPTEAVELWTFVRRPGSQWQVSAIQGAA